jgi:hypothetical protein
MFAFMLAATLFQAGSADTSPPSPAQTTAPLREIVFKYSDNETIEYTTDQETNGYTTDESHGGLAAPPESSRSSSGYSGRMTIDILQVDPTSGYLKAAVHETADAENGRAPFDAVFIVHPDGSLINVSGSYDADMTNLMPYFGATYFDDHPLQQGTQWVDGSTFNKTQYETTTTVTGVEGDDVSLRSDTKVVHGLMNGSLSTVTTLTYDAPKLVPITLDVLSTRIGSGDTSNAEQVSHYHFDRLSDTLDPTN